MKIISRCDAKSQGLKFYFTGKQCKHGHIDYRFVNNGNCTECLKQYRKDNAEKRKQYRKDNAEKRKQYNATHACESPTS